MYKKNRNLVVTFFISAFFFVSFPVIAKDMKKHTVSLSGDFDISFDFEKQKAKGQDEVDQETQRIYLSSYYYVADNFALGLGFVNISASYESDNFKSETDRKGIIPGALYNLSLDEKTSVRFSLAYAKYETEYSSEFSPSSKDKMDGWMVGSELNVYLIENASLDFKLQYFMFDVDEEDSNSNIDYSGLNAGMGLTVYFQ